LEAQNRQGMAGLKEALNVKADSPSPADGGNAVDEYVKNRREKFKYDLDAMYRELRRGDAVPPEKLEEVLAHVEKRLNAALGGRITSRMCYNRLTSENVSNTSPDEHWSQPLSLMLQSARLFRRCLTDAFFPRNFTNRSFDQQDFEKAMNVFGDLILEPGNVNRAKAELAELDEIEESDQTNREKCHAIWQVIKGSARQP
jgi:hypothetical protein